MSKTGKSGSRRQQKRTLKQMLIHNWDPGIVLIVAGLAGAIILAVLSLVSSSQAAENLLIPSEVSEGSLLFKTDGCRVITKDIIPKLGIENSFFHSLCCADEHIVIVRPNCTNF